MDDGEVAVRVRSLPARGEGWGGAALDFADEGAVACKKERPQYEKLGTLQPGCGAGGEGNFFPPPPAFGIK
jgi:hypothetical protein